MRACLYLVCVCDYLLKRACLYVYARVCPVQDRLPTQESVLVCVCACVQVKADYQTTDEIVGWLDGRGVTLDVRNIYIYIYIYIYISAL